MCIYCVLDKLGIDTNRTRAVVFARLSVGLRESDLRNREGRKQSLDIVVPLIQSVGHFWESLSDDEVTIIYGIYERPYKFDGKFVDSFIGHIVDEAVKRYEDPSYVPAYFTPSEFRSAYRGEGGRA